MEPWQGNRACAIGRTGRSAPPCHCHASFTTYLTGMIHVALLNRITKWLLYPETICCLAITNSILFIRSATEDLHWALSRRTPQSTYSFTTKICQWDSELARLAPLCCNLKGILQPDERVPQTLLWDRKKAHEKKKPFLNRILSKYSTTRQNESLFF